MPFHGYGLAYCNLASCPILDCPHDHDAPLQHLSNRPLPRLVGHASNSPIDFSKHCTCTAQGTWSVGEGRTTTEPPPYVNMQTSTSHHGAAFLSDDSPSYKNIITETENVTPPRLAAAVKSNKSKDRDAEESSLEREERERIEYEKRHAAFLEKVRATGFPLPMRPGENQATLPGSS